MNSLLRYTRHSAFLATTIVAGTTCHNLASSKDASLKSNTYSASNSAHNTTTCEEEEATPKHRHSIPSSKPRTKLLFLGSGSSTGCPKPICALTFQHSLLSKEQQLKFNPGLLQLQKDIEAKCHISKIASRGDPKRNRNYRNNPSLLISHRNNDDDDDDASSSSSSPLRNVIIDVGKTFREGALRWMPHHGIYHIDGIVLTHEHADAILGLDDLRGFQIAPHMMMDSRGRGKQSAGISSSSLPVFLSPLCLETVKEVFSYLVPKISQLSQHQQQGKEEEESGGAGKVHVVRHVAALDFQTVQFFQPFYAAGLKMIPLPVKHGEDLIRKNLYSTLSNTHGDRFITLLCT